MNDKRKFCGASVLVQMTGQWLHTAAEITSARRCIENTFLATSHSVLLQWLHISEMPVRLHMASRWKPVIGNLRPNKTWTLVLKHFGTSHAYKDISDKRASRLLNTFEHVWTCSCVITSMSTACERVVCRLLFRRGANLPKIMKYGSCNQDIYRSSASLNRVQWRH